MEWFFGFSRLLDTGLKNLFHIVLTQRHPLAFGTVKKIIRIILEDKVNMLSS